MQITAVRTLTSALTAPALSSSVTGSLAILNWAPPIPTGQSIIAGYRVYKAASLNGTYAQVGAALPSGQLTFTDTISATAFYKVEAFDQFVTGARSGAVNCNPVTGTGTKYHPGNYFWWDNQFGHPGSNQMTNYAAHINALLNDPLITGTEIVLTWADISDPTLTNGKQTFGVLHSIVDPILTKIRTRVGSAFYLIAKMWQVFFNTQSMTDTTMWPQWLVNKGNWLIPVIDTNGNERVVLDYNNPAVWAALTEMHQGVGDAYDADPNFEMYALQDESDAVSVGSVNGGPQKTIMDSANYQTRYLQMHLDVKPHFPRSAVWVTFNYLPPGDSTVPAVMSNMITTLRTAFPGGFYFGQPDPWIRSSTFIAVAQGTSGTVGNIRGTVMLMAHIEEVGLGNTGSPPTKPAKSPAQIYADAVDTNHAQYLVWNYEDWEFYKSADQIAAIHGRNGVTAAAPTEGTFNTTPGVHA